jgi:hypothetical protein
MLTEVQPKTYNMNLLPLAKVDHFRKCSDNNVIPQTGRPRISQPQRKATQDNKDLAFTRQFNEVNDVSVSHLRKRPVAKTKQVSPFSKQSNQKYKCVKDFHAQDHAIIKNMKANDYIERKFDCSGTLRSFDVKDNWAVICDDDGVKLLDLKSGKFQWTFKYKLSFGIRTQIKILGNDVIFEVLDKSKPKVQILDFHTGEIKTSEMDGFGHGEKIQNKDFEESLIIRENLPPQSLAHKHYVVNFTPKAVHVINRLEKEYKTITLNQPSLSSAALCDDRMACGFISDENGKNIPGFCVIDLKKGDIVHKVHNPLKCEKSYSIDKIALQDEKALLYYSTGTLTAFDFEKNKCQQILPKQLESKDFLVSIVSENIYIYDKQKKTNKKLVLKKGSSVSSAGIDEDCLACGMFMEQKNASGFYIIDLGKGEISHKYALSSNAAIDKVVLNKNKAYLEYSTGQQEVVTIGNPNCKPVDVTKRHLSSDNFWVYFEPETMFILDKRKETRRSTALRNQSIKNESISCVNIHNDRLAYAFVEKGENEPGFRVIDLMNGKNELYDVPHIGESRINHVVFNEKWACLEYSSGKIVAVNLSSKETFDLGENENAFDLALDGSLLISASKESIGEKSKLKFWDIESRKQINEMELPSLHAISFDSGHVYAAVGNSLVQLNYLADPSVLQKKYRQKDGVIFKQLWNEHISQRKEKFDYPNLKSHRYDQSPQNAEHIKNNMKKGNCQKIVLNSHSGDVNAFDIDVKRHLAVTCDNNQIILWNTESKKRLWAVEYQHHRKSSNKIKILGSHIFFESFDKGTQRLTLRILTLENGEEVGPDSPYYKLLLKKTMGVLGIHHPISSQFKRLNNKNFSVSIFDRMVAITDLQKNKTKEIRFDPSSISCVDINDNHLVCGLRANTDDGNFLDLYSIDLGSGKKKFHKLPEEVYTSNNKIESILLDKDWAYLGYSSGMVAVVNLDLGGHVVLGHHSSSIFDLAMEGKILVSSSRDQNASELIFWDAMTMEKIGENQLSSLHAMSFDSGHISAAVGNSLVQLNYVDPPVAEKRPKKDRNDSWAKFGTLNVQVDNLLEELASYDRSLYSKAIKI